MEDKDNPMVYAGEYLRQNVQQAQKQANSLTKAAVIRKPEEIIEDILACYTYYPIILNAHSTRIVEERPNELLISWPVSGNVDLFGKLDNRGEFISSPIRDGKLIEKWIYPKKISNNSALLVQVRNDLERRYQYLRKHIDSLNTSITFHNIGLEETVTTIVNRRLSELGQIDEIEGILNQPLLNEKPN